MFVENFHCASSSLASRTSHIRTRENTDILNMAVRYTDLENVEQIQYDDTGVRPIQVPGFGLPVYFDPVRIGR